MKPSAVDFPPGTSLYHFFQSNERKWRPDRRYLLLRSPERRPHEVSEALTGAIGSGNAAAHAAVFAALEAVHRPRANSPRRILVIRLSAFGDFVQAAGPFAAIRQHHRNDHVTLLTTRPFADFARELGYFDAVWVDERPRRLALSGWFNLGLRLRRGRFDRVYDLQTSQRSAAYAWLLRPSLPEWSGICWGCSHPHANPDRDRQHTLDKQAEQLLMAGIYPTPLPALPRFDRPLPPPLVGRAFVLLAPGASPRHPAKRWPAAGFAAVARELDGAGYLTAIIGSAAEAPLAAAIRAEFPAALDLTGRTDLGQLASLAQSARLTIGNDSGVCHLAAAAGCPVLVLFSGETDPARHAPRGRLVRIVAETDLGNLAADRVTAKTLAMLDGEAGPVAAAAAG